MFDRLYGFILVFRAYFIVSGLLVLSGIFMLQNDNRQIKSIRTIATVSVGVLQQQLAFIPRYFYLKQENDALREINIRLADEVNQLREAKLENMRLRGLLGFKDTTRSELLAARVVGRNYNLLRQTITLDVGGRDGVRPRMTVMNERGLVGLVSDVTGGYSVVTLILNTRFRASAKVQRSRVDGIIAWDGRNVLLTNVAKTMDVKPGDVVITSEYSSTFAPGIRIGIVADVTDEEGSLFKQIRVIPSVDFVRLEETFVVLSLPAAEKDSLEAQALAK